METELHLPDDAPVVVDTSNGAHATGSVLLCEDFQILLLLDRDIGDRILSAHLMVEPWKLLETLNLKITTLNPSIHKIAIELLKQGPKLATKEDISKVVKGQPEVLHKLEQNDIVTVWGPPGTGKTYTMSQIAKLYMKQEKSILIVSHSNVSVDGVIKKIVEILDKDMMLELQKGKILRYGYVRDDELSKNLYATSFNFALGKCTTLAAELDALTKKREELKQKRNVEKAEYDAVEKKIKDIRSEVRKEEKRYVERAQLIGTTISRATVDPMFDTRQFDLVMFDEVSMAYVPQVIAAAALAREKFLCVGDFRQLAPISQCQNANLLKTDIFSFLKIIDNDSNMYWHPWLVMLNEQRRMHPDIAGFSNKYIYKSLLTNHESVQKNRNKIVNSTPLSGDALNLIDLAGTYCAADKNTDGSRFNILSAVISFLTAISATNSNVEKAKGRIVVSVPSGRLREKETEIIQAIDKVHNRGIDVLMKTNEFSELPDTWKKYCLETENATFPLIVIDDETLWYGIPTANWSFRVNRSLSLMTVVHLMIRIKGKNTIEMIKALTELETIQVGVNKRSLVNSVLGSNQNVLAVGNRSIAIGLAEFVEKKEFCPDCKNHMILTKNQRGTAYLRCSNKNCKKMKYLTADLMNWYIESQDVCCPRNDGGELRGILGQYGPYVKCSEGHFLKPEEI